MKFEPEVFDVVKAPDPQARQYVVVKINLDVAT